MLQESLSIPKHWEWVCELECDIIGKYTFLYAIDLLQQLKIRNQVLDSVIM